MSELPDADEFVRAVAAVEVDRNLSLGMVVARVVARRPRSMRFSSPDELAEAVDGGDGWARELEADVLLIRGVLSGELAKAGVSVGVEALDEVLLARLQEPGVSDPLKSSVTRFWEVAGAGSLLVFPLHSLGITPLEPLKNPDLLLNAEWELAIGSQTNDYGQSASLCEGVCEKLGVRGKFPHESLHHRWLARRVEWLKRNPLLFMRVTSPVGTPGLDDRILLARLRVTTAFLAMLSTLKVSNGYPALNSRVINNVQTLDIENYVLITPEYEPAPATVVPIREWQPELVELSDLEVQLHPEVWDGAGRMPVICTRAARSSTPAICGMGSAPSPMMLTPITIGHSKRLPTSGVLSRDAFGSELSVLHSPSSSCCPTPGAATPASGLATPFAHCPTARKRS